MSLFDLLVVVVAAVAAVGGYRLGFFTRVLSWIGLGLGIYIAIRFLPRIVNAANFSDADERLLLAAIVLLGAAFIGQGAGMLLGSRVQGVLPLGPLRSIDKGVGAIVGIFGVLVALWLLLPSISSVSGWPARATRDSVIARWISGHVPQPPSALESLVDSDDFPQVFAALRPGEAVGLPPATDPLNAAVTSAISASTVKVEGQACNRIQEGSGFAVAPDLILTNAHVVAGEPAGSTAVLLPSGADLPATVVAYDPNRDVALLHVPNLGEAPLPLATGKVGEHGAVFGHPGGQNPLAIQPATIAQEITAVGEDLYDRHHTSRDVFVLAAVLAPGDSGGALVDRSGQVVGVAFAIALDRSDTAYALTTREIDADITAPRTGAAVSTEACLSG